MAQGADVDDLDVSQGNLVSSAIRFEVSSLDNAARIRKETGMLTIAVGRINDPDQTESILANDKADMVVIGRGQIAAPEFCNKAKGWPDRGHPALR